VIHEFAVDTKNSQFKAPFNQIKNLHHVATYKDTAVVTPNSDTPYSTLWMDLRTEPMVISVPAVPRRPKAKSSQPAAFFSTTTGRLVTFTWKWRSRFGGVVLAPSWCKN
jgi:hypothetical protein